MPTIACAALREDDAADAVEPGHVGDRRHHDDVGDADIGRDVAGGERRDHDLRQAERQLAHAGGDDRGAAAAADADDAGDIVAALPRSAAKAAAMAATARPRSPEAERFLRACRRRAGDFAPRRRPARSPALCVPTSTIERRAAGRRDRARRDRQVPRPWCRRCRRHRCASRAPPSRRGATCRFADSRRCNFLRRAYHIDMLVSRQSDAGTEEAERGPKAGPGRAPAG